VFRGTFDDADAFCFHTAAERLLVERTYPVAEKPQIVLGLGVGESAGAGRRGSEILGLGDRPYIVSVGRVDEHKGSKMLASYFSTYKERHPGPLALALVGPISVVLDPHPDIVITGTVDEADKWDIVRQARVAVSPSALESFSLVVLEAWIDRVPVMVNGTCGPTREHCERSGGGLWFTSYREFEAALDRLLGDPALRTMLGEAGRAYVDRFYQWPVLIERYADFLESVVARGRGTPGLL
jgi:glycosyltransferase involved in cell wall biosynthesis